MVATKRNMKVVKKKAAAKKAKKTKLDKSEEKFAAEGHSRLAPSSAERWSTCTASVALYDKVKPKEEPSEHADRGTRLHGVSYEILTKDKPAFTKRTLAKLPLDEREAIEPYIELVQLKKGDKFYEVELIFIEGSIEGTGDCVILNYDTSTIEVIDLKCGAGVPVSATRNRQLVCYGLGALIKYGDLHMWKHIRMTISQNAVGNPNDHWTQTVKEMYGWAHVLRDSANDIDAGDVVYLPSEKACQWCKVKLHCPEIQLLSQQAAHADFKDLTGEVVNPDNGYITELNWGELYDMVPVLEGYCKAIKDGVRNQLHNDPDTVNGYMLGKGRASWSWKDEDRAMKLLEKLDLEPEEFMTARQFRSVAQVKNIMKTELDMKPAAVDKKLAKLIRNTPTAPGIVKDDGTKKKYNKQDAARDDFGGKPKEDHSDIDPEGLLN